MAQQSISVANGETQSKIYDVVKDGVTGITPDNMKEINVQSVTNGVNLTFTEPDDTIIDGQTICSVRGVRVVMKEGTPPKDENDGTLILENEEPGKYSETPYEVRNLSVDKTYYFGFFSYSVHDVFNRNAKNVKGVFIKPQVLYGFKIDKNDPNPATRITYLEQAVGMTPAHMDFETGQFDYGDWDPDEIFFLKNNKPFMVNLDGTAAYELDENDYTKKLDGTDSDIASTAFNGNAMAKMETVWLYQYEDEQYEYCYISDTKINDNYHAYAHERADGTIQEYIWLAMFEGGMVNSSCRSLKGLSVGRKCNAANDILLIHRNGDLWNMLSWSQRNLINMLLHLMFKSDDLQTALGNGYHDEPKSVNLLSTGGAFNKGRFYGSNKNKDYVKAFHMENLWGNAWEEIIGMLNNNGEVLVKMEPPYNLIGTEYASTGVSVSQSVDGFINETNMSQYGRIGYGTPNGSSTTYACDGLRYVKLSDTPVVTCIGGCANKGLRCGPLCMDMNLPSDYHGEMVTTRISCEEPLTEEST